MVELQGKTYLAASAENCSGCFSVLAFLNQVRKKKKKKELRRLQFHPSKFSSVQRNCLQVSGLYQRMLQNNLIWCCLLSVYTFRSLASRGTVRLWLSVQAVLMYITHNKVFVLFLYNTALFCGRARNVGMWIPAKLVGREFPRPGGLQPSPCLHLLFNVLGHLQCMLLHAARSCYSPSCICSSHRRPGWPRWVCALWGSQDVANERANVGKARTWLYVHNIK